MIMINCVLLYLIIGVAVSMVTMMVFDKGDHIRLSHVFIVFLGAVIWPWLLLMWAYAGLTNLDKVVLWKRKRK